MTKFKLKDQIQENKLLTSFSIFFVIVFVFLGVWQIERAAHKEGLLQAFNAEQESPPIRLTSQSPDWSRVFVDGIFDSSRQILIDNQIHKGRVGYKIFTPFRFDDNKIVLVDRGWIAQGQSRSDLPQLKILEKKSRIIATVTSPEQGVLAGSELLTNEWPRVSQTKAVEVIASAFKEPILDIVLVLDPGSSQITEFIQIKPFAITPVKHYGYAMQWFTMSIVLLGMFLYALKREK
ncbi:SURF1 family protein [Gammaproteobacteria bacterium]|nr:SURF1 family protein [Gammaproteobacteria bacterium]MDC1400938.1 SURF1 family protein [Gammaproteobacteria bacterium]